MMVPRSYHLQQVSPSPPRSSAEKMGVRSTRSVASTSSIMRIKSTDNKENEFVNRNMALKSVTPTAPAHSKPVVIPSRTPARLATVTSTQTVRARGHNGGRPAPASQHHRPDSIPPAVAALLAVTSIPKMPPRRRKGATTDRRISMDELIEEWKQDGSDGVPSVVGSPLDLLLGRIDESDDEYGSLRSLEQEKDSITTRSISSESIGMTLPSLDLDAPSLNSNWDNLSTPESYRRSISDRREKAVQSPPKEDCILDHPLLHFTHQEYGEVDDVKVPELAISPSTSSERFRSFKSNLTASLQALRSAAKSFSNFTAPSVPPDDLLTRSLLSPKFTSEMRPKQLQGLPSPALRRYLNPQPPSISPTELSMELHEALLLDTDTEAPMIQMQTYDRRSRSTSRKRKSSDPYSEAGRAESPVPAVRQREPRENCDFLRVIVLEMNMRRVGKLDAKAVGRARIWLPPRKLSSNRVPSAQGESVPDRWIALVAEDVR